MSDSKKYRQPTDAEAGSVSVSEPLNVNSESGTTARIAQESTLTSIDALLEAIEDALASVGTDQLRVDVTNQPLDVSAATVTVADDGSFEVQAPTGGLDVSGATVTVADDGSFVLGDLTGTTTAASTTSTGSSNAAEVTAADGRTAVTYMWDVSGSATVTVEESVDGTNWYQRETQSPSGAEAKAAGFTTGADHVRVHVDQNLNEAEISVKGV